MFATIEAPAVHSSTATYGYRSAAEVLASRPRMITR